MPIKQKKGTLHRVGPIHDIPIGEGRCFLIENRQIAVFHLEDGSIRAIDQRCPHRGGPLSDGLVGRNEVICPLHDLKINLQTGTAPGHPDLIVQTYPIRIEQEEILLDIQGQAGILKIQSGQS